MSSYLDRRHYLDKVLSQLASEGIVGRYDTGRLVFQPPKTDMKLYVDLVTYDNHELVIEISAAQDTPRGHFGLGVLSEYDAPTRLGDAVNAVRFFTGH